LGEFVDAEIGGEPYLLVGESDGGYLSRPPAHRRPVQVRGRSLICPTGRHLRPAVRAVPQLDVRRADDFELDPAGAEQFDDLAAVCTAESVRRFVADILLGLQAVSR